MGDELFRGRWVRVMTETASSGVWEADGTNGDPDDLPIDAPLKARLQRWCDVYDEENNEHLKPGHSERGTFLHERQTTEGYGIAAALKAALPEWTVVFHDSARAALCPPYWSGEPLRRGFFEYEVPGGTVLTPRPAAWRLERYATLPSTSDTCLARARQGEPEGLAIQALRQTAGRGSRGRTWDTGDGNLALSVLLLPREPVRDAGQWALAAAVGLRAGLANFADGLTIKWPNDIVRGGRKIAGLLVDSSLIGDLLEWVVIGMGANLRRPPAIDPGSDAVLAAALGPHDPAEVAECVLDRLGTVLRVWRDDGFEAIRQLWLAHAHPPGTPLRVRSARHDVSGAFHGITPDGALLLATADGVRAFSTGEVLLG